MGDESDPITAAAKAVEETAKTGRALVEAGSDLARFVGKALGTVPEDTVGLLGGNLLHELHIRNLDKVSRKTEEILRQRGVEDPEPIGPKALLPALEAASEETDETLQDMWANLLANAMDPNRPFALQRVFTETLEQFEPLDALVFQRAGEIAITNDGRSRRVWASANALSTTFKLRETQIDLSAGHLFELECIKPMGPRSNSNIGEGFELSTLGYELYLACTGRASD